ncbi:MAG: formylglycine-generating enzyme family protein [Chloroflexi bacterium]|nr:formylglycine-generating enzyme family protein [Chloroflexota bacterium]
MKLVNSKMAFLFVLLSGFSLLLISIVAVPTLAKPSGDRWSGANAAQISVQVFVPAGPFSMGCAYDLSYEHCDVDARPVHTVYLDSFYIDRTEVTNAQYQACEEAGACLPPLDDRSETRSNYYKNPQFDNYPVIYVDSHRARAFCQWAGKRLPTEAEWEKAARGTDLRLFPWGNDEPSCDRANYRWGIDREYNCVGDTVAVGSYPENVSPYGALDMAGNVCEWTSDIYASRYYHNSPYHNPQGAGSTDKNEGVVRGGSWKNSWRGVTTYVRLDESEVYKWTRNGIRCARTGPAPMPTPSPTPTPMPFAVGDIGPDGGALWLANPEHLTLLSAAPGVVDANTTFTITFDGRQNTQHDLQGIDHFFYLDASPSISESGTITMSIPGTLGSLNMPLKLTLGFTRSNFYGMVTDTLGLYRLGPTDWVTNDIAVVERAGNYLVAWVGHTGVYGVMGKTNRLYLPVVFRGAD